jgi:hypothetical protein
MLKVNDFWMSGIDYIFDTHKEFELGADEQRRLFVDRNSKILFVAHLDTVKLPRIDTVFAHRVSGAGFDDRLGCKIAWELGKELGCDVLLTDYEEDGCSSAQYHELKDYNWICEFDRAGNDVVTYGMENDAWINVLDKHWIIGNGCFSDLSFMDTKCCAMNLGISYELAHCDNSYYNPQMLSSQLKKFRKFFKKQCQNKYVMDEGRREYVLGGGCGFGSTHNHNDHYYQKWMRDDYGVCNICGNWADEDIYDMFLCEDCVDRMVNAEIRI